MYIFVFVSHLCIFKLIHSFIPSYRSNFCLASCWINSRIPSISIDTHWVTRRKDRNSSASRNFIYKKNWLNNKECRNKKIQILSVVIFNDGRNKRKESYFGIGWWWVPAKSSSPFPFLRRLSISKSTAVRRCDDVLKRDIRSVGSVYSVF